MYNVIYFSSDGGNDSSNFMDGVNRNHGCMGGGDGSRGCVEVVIVVVVVGEVVMAVMVVWRW